MVGGTVLIQGTSASSDGGTTWDYTTGETGLKNTYTGTVVDVYNDRVM